MQLFKNDAIAQMQLLHQQGVKVNAIVTDPPYGCCSKRVRESSSVLNWMMNGTT